MLPFFRALFCGQLSTDFEHNHSLQFSLGHHKANRWHIASATLRVSCNVSAKACAAIRCAVKIEMQRGRRQKIQRGVELSCVSLLRAKRRFSAAVAFSGCKRNASLNCAMASEGCPNRI